MYSVWAVAESFCLPLASAPVGEGRVGTAGELVQAVPGGGVAHSWVPTGFALDVAHDGGDLHRAVARLGEGRGYLQLHTAQAVQADLILLLSRGPGGPPSTAMNTTTRRMPRRGASSPPNAPATAFSPPPAAPLRPAVVAEWAAAVFDAAAAAFFCRRLIGAPFDVACGLRPAFHGGWGPPPFSGISSRIVRRGGCPAAWDRARPRTACAWLLDADSLPLTYLAARTTALPL